jgi:hypothetical protein
MANFAQLARLQDRLGLTPLIGWNVATIISLAGGIEHHIERALWRLRGIDPNGMRPDTDTKMISDLIKLLQAFATSVADDRQRRLLESWCEAAQAGFTIRLYIAHGAPMRLDGLVDLHA